jgi:hypothetical protein
LDYVVHLLVSMELRFVAASVSNCAWLCLIFNDKRLRDVS